MSVWPMLLDMSRDDCKRLLRRLELEAYGSIVSAMRAQGALSSEKRKLLQDLCATLNISMERHKAEIRRVANDERLATVAELMGGPNSTTDWAIEGRRLIPLLPRLVPQTAFTALANNVANITAAENATLPPPSQTVKTKETAYDRVSQNEPGIPEASKTSQQSNSPLPANHMMLPPGTSIRLKKDGEEEFKSKKRPRSTEGRPHSPKLPPVKISIPPHQKIPLKTSYPLISTPIKITPLRTTAVTHSPSTTQKVIIVSSSTTIGSSNSSSILQRSLSGPLVKPAGSLTNVGQHLRGTPSLVLNNPMSNSSMPPTSSTANIVTISANPLPSTNISATTSKVPFTGAPTAAYVGTSSGVPRIRPMTLQLPARPRPRSSSIIIPTTPGMPSPQRAILQAVRPNLQPKPDIMNAKTIGISTATKILPKPSFTSASVSPMYVMSTATPAPITMITRAMPSNISPRINPALVASPPVIHSLPAIGARHPFPLKTIPKVTAGVTPPGARQGGGGKTNVIVVQKGATSGYTRGVTLAHSVKKVALSKGPTATQTASTIGMSVKKPAANVHLAAKPQAIQLPGHVKPGTSIILLDLGKEAFSKTTVLADLLQASGIPIKKTAEQYSAGNKSVSTMADQREVRSSLESQELTSADVRIEGQPQINQETSSVEEDIFGDAVNTEHVQPVPTDEDRTITIEEAVELLGHSDSPETRALLSQAGIEVRDHVPEQTSSTEVHTSIPHVVHEEDVVSGDNDVMEVLGELDPQTGVYSVHTAIAGGSGDSAVKDNAKPSPAPMDIFSTALASADINLDSFQYMDDRIDQYNTTNVGSTGTHEFPTFTEASLDQTSLESASNQMEVEQQFQLEDSSEDTFDEFIQPNMESNAVMVEPSHMDTTEMYIEDFTSQKM